MKRRMTCIAIIFLFSVSCPNQSFALNERPVSVDSKVFHEMYSDQFDINNKIDINNCETVPEYIEEVIDARLDVDKSQSIKSTWNLNMGLDTTYLSANDGDAYCDVWTGSESDGDYFYDWGTDSNISYGGWADAKTYLISTLGSGDQFEGAAIAWVGNEFTVLGTQTEKTCTVTFYGDYSGQVSHMSDALARSKIILRIIDRTDSNRKIMDGVINTSPSGTINHYGTVILKKDHIYEFQMIVWTEGHVDDPFPSIYASTAISNYWSNGLEGYGLDYSGIEFDWQ